jgi:tRNA (guanine26-N2/guanine27-N2)-dimethyltransferase
MKEDLDNRELGTRKDLAKILDLCLAELPTSSHYDYHQIAKLLGCSPPNIDTVINRIIEQGFPTTRTHFSGYGIKTEAPLDVIKAAIKGPALQ